MLPLRVCLAESDHRARSVLAAVVARVEECSVVAECDDAASTAAAIRAWSPNVVVADSRLPPTDVFALIRELSVAAELVFVLTAASDRDAMRAFTDGAVDCMAKPIDPARFRLALGRARAHLIRVRALHVARELSAVIGAVGPLADATGSFLTQLHIPGARAAVIPAGAIDWIAAEDCYSRVFVDRASFLLRRTLGALERQLDPREFVRTHRSAIVNARRVADVTTGRDGDTTLVLSSGTIVPVSQRRRSAVLRALGARDHNASGHPWRSAPIV